MITLKNAIFTRYASMNMLKFLLNSQFLNASDHMRWLKIARQTVLDPRNPKNYL